MKFSLHLEYHLAYLIQVNNYKVYLFYFELYYFYVDCQYNLWVCNSLCKNGVYES